MIKLELLNNDAGLIVNGRLAKAGDVVEADAKLARELLAADAATLCYRMRARNEFLVGTQVYAPGDFGDFPPHVALHLLESKVADRPRVKIIAKTDVVAGMATFKKASTAD